MTNRTYIAIDLKSFYASVECIERGLNPLTTHLVVADESRTTKTICLAVSPALKIHGIGGRPRLFEVVRAVRDANAKRKYRAPQHRLTGETTDATELAASPHLGIAYHIAPPRMALYVAYSVRVYEVYLRHIAPADIHIYSIDEVFIDATSYLDTLHISAHDFALRLIREVLQETGVTATAGIGTNLYLAKIAMDIVAKRMKPDVDGVRVAQLDELSYRQVLWAHRPLTDFWRIGRGYAAKLEANGLYTMGDIARCSLGKASEHYNEDLLYRLFGVQAELLIDHAWGIEPVTMDDIKAYRPHSKSLTNAQVLSRPYAYEDARTVIKEMCDASATDMVADSLTLGVRYDRNERGLMLDDGGTSRLSFPTNSRRALIDAAMDVFGHRVDPRRSIRYLMITFNGIADEDRTQIGGQHPGRAATSGNRRRHPAEIREEFPTQRYRPAGMRHATRAERTDRRP